MKMLMRCSPDAADSTSDNLQTRIQCLNVGVSWRFFADEKEQVANDLKQLSSYWKSKEQQALLQSAVAETDRRRSMRRILGRQLDNSYLVPLIIEYL
jgi:hypothetical protein